MVLCLIFAQSVDLIIQIANATHKIIFQISWIQFFSFAEWISSPKSVAWIPNEKPNEPYPNFVRVVVVNTFDDLKTKSVWQMAILLCKASRREKTEFYFQIIDWNAEIYIYQQTWATNSKMDDAEWIWVNQTTRKAQYCNSQTIIIENRERVYDPKWNWE